MRTLGTVVRGVRAPIVKQGDDLVSIVTKAIVESANVDGYQLNDRDVVGVTESILARSQGNFASVTQIADDVRSKIPGGIAGITLPILSRNRFQNLLKGISLGLDKLYIQLAYPSDEVGNHLITLDQLDEAGVNPYTDVLTEEEFRAKFGETVHFFTGINYVNLYKDIAPNAEIILANDPRAMLKFTKHVITCDIHSRFRSKRLLKAAGAITVLGLDDLLTTSVNGSGFNREYGLLGSNKASEASIKLFPKDCDKFISSLATSLLNATGKHIECMIYGDGAFKDPVGKIWELADPVVSPGFTDGLRGTPSEIKLKFIADNQLKELSGEDARIAAIKLIKEKDDNLVGSDASLGTTPRQITDLLGSLCDLTSGSGDKGTPIILVQGYFDNYAS